MSTERIDAGCHGCRECRVERAAGSADFGGLGDTNAGWGGSGGNKEGEIEKEGCGSDGEIHAGCGGCLRGVE